MKKHAKKILSWMLVLCMLVGIVPMVALADSGNDSAAVEFKAQQLSLSDDLTMRFYVAVDDEVANSAVMQITVAGNSTDYPIQNMTTGADGCYVFSVDLAAAQMTEDISLVLKSGEEILGQKTYSVQDYAHALLEGDFSNATKQMVKEVLNYGAKAQAYFGYKTGALANAGYELDAAAVAAVPEEVLEISMDGQLENASFYGASLVFESKIAVRFYFTGSSEGISFKVGQTEYSPTEKDGLFYVEVPGINPQNMDENVVLTVADSMSIGYSPLHYITRMYHKAGTSQALKNLLQAMYGYHLAAEEFTGVAGDYDNGIDLSTYANRLVLFENDFSTDANKGVTAAWHKSPFNGSTAALEDGWVRLTSDEHLFVYGGHTYGNYGGFSFAKNTLYKMSFDLKLGEVSANKTFNLYVMTENGDPRFGNIVKTLKLDFADNERMVLINSDDFASVTYDHETGIAHIEAVFTTDASVNTEVVSKCAGTNNWLIDNLVFAKTFKNVDYSNGVSHDNYTAISTLFENDYSESVDSGASRTGFYGSTAVLEDGWVRLTSSEHLFTFGRHTWAIFGGVDMAKSTTYKMSFDLKLGDGAASETFNLYLMEDAGNDPRFGTVRKTLTLNFTDVENLAAVNTDNFASVVYDSQSQIAHIEAMFTTSADVNTEVVSKCSGTNNWLLDNLVFEKMIPNADYDNGISFAEEVVEAVIYDNDYSESADKGSGRTGFNGSTAVLENGWARVTSNEHIFTLGRHTWGIYGSMDMAKATEYKVSFDLKLGDTDANKTFTLYVMNEISGADPRWGTVAKTLTLNFADLANLVTTNTDDFASVTYTAATKIAHIEILFTTDAAVNTQIVSRCNGTNNWLLDNLKCEKVGQIKNYDNGISFADKEVETVIYDNDYSENVDKGSGRTGFNGSTAVLEDGWARVTSTEHIFTLGCHTWGIYGSVNMAKDTQYKMSFDLKLGDATANKTFNLYVMTEKSGTDPRFGNVVKTLTLNFADIDNFVTTNTDDFASVVYDGRTHIAHIELLFTTDATANTNVVSKCSGTNNWLLDNLKVEKIGTPLNYDNGISFDDYIVESVLFENDFSESVDNGASRTGFYGSTAVLEDGWVRLTSTEHLFTFGCHTWAIFGGVDMAKGTTYKMSFDLKLGDSTAAKTFCLYVMQDAGNDPRFGTVVKTLNLNFSDIENLVVTNTDSFASVAYDGETGIAHIEILFTTDGTVNTEVVSKYNGTNNWLLDNLIFQEVSTISNPLLTEGVLLKSFDYGDVTLNDGLYKETFDGCMAYYDQLSADDILYRWRKVSGMDTLTGRDLGWEAGTTNPECCIAQLISYKARYYAITGDSADLQLVKDILNGYQEIIDTTGGYPLMYHHYFYEKTLRALMDCYTYCGLEQGYTMAKDLIQYGLTTEKYAQPEKLLGDNSTEWYTMGEALYQFARLAESKGETTVYVNNCKNFAARYMYKEYWDVFYNGENMFDYSPEAGIKPEYFHAYSHLNSLNSAMEAYLQTGDTYYLNVAKAFYTWAEQSQKFATGGYGVQYEWLLPRDEMVEYLRTSAASTETQCNAYAVVNLDNRLMAVTGNAAYGQWTEDAFYNMTIASLETTEGCPHYYSDYSSDGGSKYLRTDWPWACCAGTRPLVVMEYLKNIYFHDTQNLYVNLYTNSSVSFENKAGNQVTLIQSSDFPVSDTVTFTLGTAFAQEFSICLRQPQWLASDAVVKVNGQAVGYDVENGWIVIKRVWKNGDTVVVQMPMELRYSVISKDSDTSDCVYAVTYGPVVLACTGNNPTLKNHLPLSGDLEKLVTREEGTLHFTVKAYTKLVLKPYYEYVKSEAYTLYISSK